MKPIQPVTVATALKNMRDLRTKKQLSIQDIANKLCVSPGRYRQMEAGHATISLDQFFHIAAILEVKVETLVQIHVPRQRTILRRVS